MNKAIRYALAGVVFVAPCAAIAAQLVIQPDVDLYTGTWGVVGMMGVGAASLVSFGIGLAIVSEYF